jgi:hypothetical protein
VENDLTQLSGGLLVLLLAHLHSGKIILIRDPFSRCRICMRQPYSSFPIVGHCSIDLLLAEMPIVMNKDFKNENLL